eukprot:c8033_g1_i1.p1 GENE.c8033_g1_i1~~c8033_g1_i1.p1  ORF type:complete len:299 (-),score=54.17 c8033_g1_i1:45-902(-)
MVSFRFVVAFSAAFCLFALASHTHATPFRSGLFSDYAVKKQPSLRIATAGTCPFPKRIESDLIPRGCVKNPSAGSFVCCQSSNQCEYHSQSHGAWKKQSVPMTSVPYCWDSGMEFVELKKVASSSRVHAEPKAGFGRGHVVRVAPASECELGETQLDAQCVGSEFTHPLQPVEDFVCCHSGPKCSYHWKTTLGEWRKAAVSGQTSIVCTDNSAIFGSKCKSVDFSHCKRRDVFTSLVRTVFHASWQQKTGVKESDVCCIPGGRCRIQEVEFSLDTLRDVASCVRV